MIPYIPPRDDEPDPSITRRLPAGDEESQEDIEDDVEDDDEDFEDDEGYADDEEPEPSWEEQLETAGNPDDLITVTTYRFGHEAEMAKLLLEQEGITAFVSDADSVAMGDFFGNMIGYVKLQVPRAQAREAVTVLTTQFPPPPPAKEDDDDEDKPEVAACLECGAPMGDNESSCTACGWTYVDKDDSFESHGDGKPR